MNPPDGLPNWLVLVLFLLFGTPALFSKFGARLPWIFGAAGRWWQSRNPEVRADAVRTASYERQEREIARLGAQYDRIAGGYEELSDRVYSLESKLTEANRRFFAALAYIRDLVSTIRRIDPEHRVKEPPEILREFL